ncbi:MAG: trypsin-like peptidase domain-containing protein [Ruminococcus sp.]|nr:trypsin-like peptidase domain-containing protein [Ruminococcus sp.]
MEEIKDNIPLTEEERSEAAEEASADNGTESPAEENAAPAEAEEALHRAGEPQTELGAVTEAAAPDAENVVPVISESSHDTEKTGIKLPPDRSNKMVYINVPPPEEDEDAFWNEVLSVKPSGNFGRRALWCTLLLLLIICILGYTFLLAHGKGFFKSLLPTEHISFTLPIAETPELEGKYVESDGSYTSAGLAKAVLPSVVQIKAFTSDSINAASQGSGIIMSEDGYIVTNAHVINDADLGVTVMLYDKAEFAAKVVGRDDSSDIAVLKISTTGLTPAQFADSDACELGDEVVAIGSPAGFENSVTKGIVSGLKRQIHAENATRTMECIQIDAAINPGNSGGPLFNMWGQVIGITSSKLVSTSYDNIGFSITINSAKPIIEELIASGYILDRGRIGIVYSAISEETAKMYGIVPGLYIREIDQDCDVANSGLKVGDIITEIAGIEVSTQQNVINVLDGHLAGEKITCKVYRPILDKKNEGKFDGGDYFDIEFELARDKSAMIEKSN